MATKDDMDRAGPRNFASVLAELSQGDFNLELGAEQQKLLAQLQDNALAQGRAGKAKGTLSVTIKYEVEANGTIKIQPSLAVKAPKPTMAATAAWIDKSANISWQDPRQQRLPLREVAGPAGEAREVPGKERSL